jgi:hypothetical protein
MSAVDVRIPETKWSMLEWKTTKEKPNENSRVLVYNGKEVIGGRYLQGDYVAQSFSGVVRSCGHFIQRIHSGAISARPIVGLVKRLVGQL